MRIQDLTSATTVADNDLIVLDNTDNSITKSITVANLKSELGLPKKAIYLELDQSGTTAPVVQEILNNTGLTVTSIYNSVGDYSLMLSGDIMTTGKVVVTSTSGVIAPYILSVIRQNENQIDIATYSTSGVYANFQLRRTGIKIEIYA